MLPAADSDRPARGPRRLTAEDRRNVAGLFRSGRSLSAIARECGIAASSVRRLLDAQGETAGRSLQTWRVLSPAEAKELRLLRAVGWTQAALAKRYGVSRTTIGNWLKKPGT